MSSSSLNKIEQSQCLNRFSRLNTNNIQSTNQYQINRHEPFSKKQFQRKRSTDALQKNQLRGRSRFNGVNRAQNPSKQSITKGLVNVRSLNSLQYFHTDSQGIKNSKDTKTKEKKEQNKQEQRKNRQETNRTNFKNLRQSHNYVNSDLQRQISSLKMFNKVLENHNEALIQKNTNLEAENLAFKNKIQIITKQKENKIQQLEQECLKIEEYKKSLKNQQEINYYLEDIIIGLNQKIEELNQHNYEKQTQLTTQNDEMVENLQRQLQEIKEENVKLKERVKYTDIEKGIKKKILYDLEKEKQRTKILDVQNQKLYTRIQNLEKVKKNIPFPQLKKYNSILENSLSFSFEYQ